MASPRLWFLYPRICQEMLVIPANVQAKSLTVRVLARTLSTRPSCHRTRVSPYAQTRLLSSTVARSQHEISQRYGTANEPPAHLGGGRQSKHKDATKDGEEEPKEEPKALPEPHTDMQATSTPTGKDAASTLFSNVDTSEHEKSNTNNSAGETPQVPSSAIAEVLGPADAVAKSSGQEALSTILAMPPPMSEQSHDADKPPHLQTPRHVHHFDTHTIVRNLQDGKWTEEQAVDVMKAVRVVLADKIELAREGLLSKADAEMETYLFNAACAELRTELKTSRATMLNTLRSERNQLQHEVDILSQRITQETTTLKDEVKGMFDDRKMAVRIERRTMDNEIQAMNNKISIVLNSEMRSEAEALRWVITRRTVMALVAIVLMSLIALRASKYMEDQQEKERKAFASMTNAYVADGGDGRSSGSRGEDSNQDVAQRVERGDSPGLVSLG